jgi:hypothetical protein
VIDAWSLVGAIAWSSLYENAWTAFICCGVACGAKDGQVSDRTWCWDNYVMGLVWSHWAAANA